MQKKAIKILKCQAKSVKWEKVNSKLVDTERITLGNNNAVKETISSLY